MHHWREKSMNRKLVTESWFCWVISTRTEQRRKDSREDYWKHFRYFFWGSHVLGPLKEFEFSVSGQLDQPNTTQQEITVNSERHWGGQRFKKERNERKFWGARENRKPLDVVYGLGWDSTAIALHPENGSENESVITLSVRCQILLQQQRRTWLIRRWMEHQARNAFCVRQYRWMLILSNWNRPR